MVSYPWLVSAASHFSRSMSSRLDGGLNVARLDQDFLLMMSCSRYRSANESDRSQFSSLCKKKRKLWADTDAQLVGFLKLNTNKSKQIMSVPIISLVFFIGIFEPVSNH